MITLQTKHDATVSVILGWQDSKASHLFICHSECNRVKSLLYIFLKFEQVILRFPDEVYSVKCCDETANSEVVRSGLAFIANSTGKYSNSAS